MLYIIYNNPGANARENWGDCGQSELRVAGCELRVFYAVVGAVFDTDEQVRSTKKKRQVTRLKAESDATKMSIYCVVRTYVLTAKEPMSVRLRGFALLVLDSENMVG